MTTYHWIGGSGNWATAADWSPSGGPVWTLAFVGGLGNIAVSSDDAVIDTGTVTVSGFAGAYDLTVAAGAALVVQSGGGLTVSGSAIDNAGNISLARTGNGGSLLTINSASVILSGGGTVTLSDDKGLRVFIDAASPTEKLINVDNTISGTGSIEHLSFDNQASGVVDGNGIVGGVQLNIDTYGGTFSNEGLIEATGTAGLIIGEATGTNTGTIEAKTGSTLTIVLSNLYNTAGTIEAVGTGAVLDLSNATIHNGTVATSSGGTIQTIIALASTTNTIDGATINNAGSFVVSDDTVLHLGSAVDNTATFSLASFGRSAQLVIDADGAVFYGGGSVTLSDQADNEIYGAGATDTLTNVDNTISGAGQIGMGVLSLNNEASGTIDGSGTNNALTLDTGTGFFSNEGLIEATGAGGLDIVGSTVINTGTIEAKTGSTLTIDSTSSATNNGTFKADGGTLIDNGAVRGSGSVTITNGGLADFTAAFNQNVTFSGANAGTLELSQPQNYHATISGFAPGDTLDLAGVAYDAVQGSANLLAGNVLEIAENGKTFDIHLNPTESFAGEYFHLSADAAGTGTDVTESSAPCYCRGTLIATRRGDARVEDLKIGDEVLTASGALRPIKWIGRRSYSGRFIRGNDDALPVCFKAGALDACVPRRDLWVSPHHAMYFETDDFGGVLIEARHLINGVSVVQAEQVETVEYFHIELDTHDVIVAEGALSETFLDDDSRGMFHNAGEYCPLYDEQPFGPAHYCAPRLDEGYLVDTIRRRLAARVGLQAADRRQPPALRGYIDEISIRRVAGWAQNIGHLEATVCLDIVMDGRVIAQVLANRHRDDLRRAGLGSGCHGFEFTAPAGLVLFPCSIEVRRSLDGCRVELSAEARKALSADRLSRQAKSVAAGSPDIRVHRRTAHAV